MMASGVNRAFPPRRWGVGIRCYDEGGETLL